MSRPFRALILCLLVSACGSSSYEAPKNLDNACSIIKQRPHYLDAMTRTERRWGVPVAVQMATIYQESKFIGNARTPRKKSFGLFPGERISTAYGYGQALDGTWEEYQDEEGGRRARRDDIRDATDFMGWYFNKSYAGLGIPLDDARNQYLAYHEGRAGYARGSYRQKAWLLRVSKEVANRAILYDTQLRTCGMA
ncbi:MAG: lytic transglycosylase [Pseudomonadota bacterium]